jgi:hypothetical protein
MADRTDTREIPAIAPTTSPTTTREYNASVTFTPQLRNSYVACCVCEAVADYELRMDGVHYHTYVCFPCAREINPNGFW